MAEQSLKHKTLSGFLWSFSSKISNQLIATVVSIILARLLEPSAYGAVALIVVITSFMSTFVSCGFGVAVIQKKDADQLDFSSVFYFNVFMGVVLYLLLFFSAPWIAAFYEMPELLAPIRVLGLQFIISGVAGMQSTYVSKTMQFRRFFYSSMGANVFSAVVGITMAYLGMGLWALIAQSLSAAVASAVILFFTVRWVPSWTFSFKRLRVLFAFGWKMVASALLNNFARNLNQLIIGKVYSPADLAFFNRGSHFPKIIGNNINNSIDGVLLPVMSKVQDDRERVRNMTRRSIQTSCFFIWPFMTLLFVGAEDLIALLMKEKWIEAVPYMQIYCIAIGFDPIATANLNAIKAMGRSDLFLKMEVVKKITYLAIVIFASQFGVMAIACSLLGYSFIAQLINSKPNKRLLGYGYVQQMRDILPSIAIAVLAGAAIWPISFLGMPRIVTLMLQIPFGLIIYFILACIFKLSPMLYATHTLAGSNIKGLSNFFARIEREIS